MASTSDAFERLTAALADRYRLIREVGSGGMAAVYLAEDLKHHREVAVKVLDPELAAAIGPERFLREIDTAAKLTHPHILPLHDSGEAAGLLYYVMPFVKGESVRTLLERDGPLPVEDALRYAMEIADALGYAHQERVVHRDVKPANILLEAGHAVLVDFGVAQAAASAGEERLTRSGLSLGTAAYMSPEQVSGEGRLDGRCDQYALGCVLFEMLAGEPPFTGPTAAQVMARQMSAPPPSVTALRPAAGPEVDRIICRTLEKLPGDRFGSVQEMRRALEAAALGAAQGAAADFLGPPGPAPPRRPRSWHRTSTFRWLVSTASLAAMVLVGGFLLLGSTNDFGFQRRDWILISDFRNGTGDPVFDRSLDNALAVGLQQSNHVNVFPRTRIAQTLQRMRREDTGELGEELGREIALRENIRLLVVPSIDRIEQTYALTIRIVDPGTGDDLLSRSEQAVGANEVLPALDKLSRKLRRDLGESRLSISRSGVPLGVATTPSLEALEAWSEGTFHWGQRRFDEGVTLLKRAIELDSTFAMAHADLGGAYYYEGDRTQGELYVRKALALSDRITERERLWILAEVESWKENYEGAIDAYNIYLTRYPDDMDGWFRLGYAFMREGHSAEAVRAFEKVVEMDPENAAAFINLATSYNLLNQREEAVEHYLRAFELAPPWRTSGNLNHEFGFNYVEMGRFDEAEAAFNLMLEGGDDQKAMGNRSLALMDMYRGRYADAIRRLREASVLHHALGYPLSEMRNRFFLASALWESGAKAEATEEMAVVRELASTPSIAPSWLAYVGKQEARMGLVEDAESVLRDAVARSDESVAMDRASVALLRGEVALAKGDAPGALEDLRNAYALRDNSFNLESLAYGLFMAGELEAARDRYLTLLSQRELGWEVQAYWMASHFRLGQIYEAAGDTANALGSYGTFLEIMRDGDPDIESVRRTRERVEALEPPGRESP